MTHGGAVFVTDAVGDAGSESLLMLMSVLNRRYLEAAVTAGVELANAQDLIHGQPCWFCDPY